MSVMFYLSYDVIFIPSKLTLFNETCIVVRDDVIMLLVPRKSYVKCDSQHFYEMMLSTK